MKTIISTLVLSIFLFASCSTSKNVREPEYRDIQDIRLGKVGLLQTTAEADLIYYNPNSFGIQLTEARGDVYIDNAYLGRFNLGETVDVNKRSEFTIPITFKLDNI